MVQMFPSNKLLVKVVSIARLVANYIGIGHAEFQVRWKPFPGDLTRFRLKLKHPPKGLQRDSQSFECFARKGTSDLSTFVQIFINEHLSLSQLTRSDDLIDFYLKSCERDLTPLIIDMGANVGYASRYFAELFERALVAAVEPVGSNAALAAENTQDCSRVTIYPSAISSAAGVLSISNEAGRMDSFTTFKDAGDGSVSVKALTVSDIISAQSKGKKVVPFIAKVDIEGFESDLFEKNVEWIDRFPLLVVELHDWMLPQKRTSQSFLREISKLDRDFVFHGEHVFSISNRLASLLPL